MVCSPHPPLSLSGSRVLVFLSPLFLLAPLGGLVWLLLLLVRFLPASSVRWVSSWVPFVLAVCLLCLRVFVLRSRGARLLRRFVLVSLTAYRFVQAMTCA